MMTGRAVPTTKLVEGGEEDADHDREQDAQPDRLGELDRGDVAEGRDSLGLAGRHEVPPRS